MPIHLQVGKQNKVAVVFSCPGRHEEEAGYPAAKNTGKNLDTLLSLLSSRLGRNDLTREEITITNAWPFVEFKARTGRSEATAKEVSSRDNIRRLQQELDEITDFVILCGEKAAMAADQLQLKHDPKLVTIRHIGLRGLSLIRTDLRGEPIVAAELQVRVGSKESKRCIQSKNSEKRLAVLADAIVAQLQDMG